MPRQDTRLEAEGAEFLVLGNVLIEGILAYKAYTNMAGYDPVAVWPETNRAARIQVKSRWATDANSHPVKCIDCDFLVLTRLNRGFRFSGRAKRELPQENPEFYVLPADVAESRRIMSGGGWSKIAWNQVAFKDFRSRWDLIRDFLMSPQSEGQ